MNQMINRRGMLKLVAAAGLASSLPGRLFGEASEVGGGKQAVLRYLETLARPDGGYGWEEQEQSHLTPTFAVIGCYRLLKETPPNTGKLAEFVRTHHPSRVKKLEQERRMFEFQQVQALKWLGEEAPSELREKIRAWKKPLPYLKQYERHGHPIFQSELGAFTCRALLGLPLEDLAGEFAGYLNARRRENGSFNNTPASEGGDGHVMNTWWGLQALNVLARAAEKKEQTAAWLRSCQLASGGFTYQPKAEFGGVDDVAYTRAAVRGLRLVGAGPENREACIRYLLSLANADGGFGDRPGWLSNPLATYYALDALEALGALDALETVQPRPLRPLATLPSNLKVWTIQLEAHGHGSPADAVELARSLRIHLWGAKNAQPAWLSRAQALADAQQVPVKFFVADEEYGTWVNVPGLGTYSHTSDIFAPAGREIGSPLANTGVVSWPEFRERRLKALMQGGGRLFWQFGENEELVRLYLDDSVQRGGYAAISTFHFGNPDFTNTEPFLQRWRGQIPYVALQDAHGKEPWWFADMTTGFRTVFLAAEPTWEGWLEALRRNWVVAIRHDVWTGYKIWMHSGSAEVLQFVKGRQEEWCWWDNPKIERPLVSIVAVRPEDELEVGRPETGVNLRVRCAWENTAQGLLKQPVAELVKLLVDDEEVSPKLVSRKAPNGNLMEDQYYHYGCGKLKAGKHQAKAIVRVIETKREVGREVEF